MHWIAPTKQDIANAALEKRFWDAAEQFLANSGPKSQEFSAPVIGLIFLRFADQRAKLVIASTSARCGSRVDESAADHSGGTPYFPPGARVEHLLNGLEAKNIGAKANTAMRDIERHDRHLLRGIPMPLILLISIPLKKFVSLN